jgi:hypothetical protein
LNGIGRWPGRTTEATEQRANRIAPVGVASVLAGRGEPSAGVALSDASRLSRRTATSLHQRHALGVELSSQPSW